MKAMRSGVNKQQFQMIINNDLENYKKRTEIYGLETVKAILTAFGIGDKRQIYSICKYFINNRELSQIYMDTQNIQGYIHAVRYLGKTTCFSESAESLASYMEEKIELIKEKAFLISDKPSVYYTVPKKHFAGGRERMEYNLVRAAGGNCVNLHKSKNVFSMNGISIEELKELNPEVIIISSFLDMSVREFMAECILSGVEVSAVRNKKIYTHLSTGWDWGSPQLVLGLMYMANILHPRIYDFDVINETKEFYHRFYNSEFSLMAMNRNKKCSDYGNDGILNLNVLRSEACDIYFRQDN